MSEKELESVRAKLSSVMQDKENQSPKIQNEEAQMLMRKNEALEKKVRKFVAHCEHLERDCDLLKDENKAVSALRSELEKVNLELERVDSEFEKAKSANADLQDIRTRNEDLDTLLSKKQTIQTTLERDITAIKQNYAKQKEINDNLKKSSKELEYEKNRQISYLENENLQYLGELKATKKEIKSLKAQRYVMNSDADDEPTEDLGSIISMNLDASNKENHPVQSPQLKSKKKSGLNKQTEGRAGLGSGEGHIEDDPGECKQS